MIATAFNLDGIRVLRRAHETLRDGDRDEMQKVRCWLYDELIAKEHKGNGERGGCSTKCEDAQKGLLDD